MVPLLMLGLACKREDPRIRELTERAAQADEASQELRQAWSEQLQRLSRAGVKDLPPGFVLMHFSEEQKVALEARIREERNVSRQGLLKELLEKDRDLVGLGDRLALMKAELPAPDLVQSNDSHYGLAAYVWTHDIGKGLRAAHALESGWVQVNQGGGQTPGMSYGGYKQSGIGREFSLEGMLDSFTQRKSVTVNLAV